MSEVAEVLSELQRRGLLDRCTSFRVGNVEIRLTPAYVPPGEEPPEARARREAQEFEDLQYGSS